MGFSTSYWPIRRRCRVDFFKRVLQHLQSSAPPLKETTGPRCRFFAGFIIRDFWITGRIVDEFDHHGTFWFWFCLHLGVSLNGGTPKHPKMSCLVGKPMVVGYHHFRKPPFDGPLETVLFIGRSEKTKPKNKYCLESKQMFNDWGKTDVFLFFC